jgi:hypothetical protein
VSAMLVMLNVALPVLVSVAACAALVLLIFWELNVRLDADRLTPGADGGGGGPPPQPTQPDTASTTTATAANAHPGASLRPALRRP